MRWADASTAPKIVMQMFSLTSHKPVQIQSFETEKISIVKIHYKCLFHKVTVHCEYLFWLPFTWIIASLCLWRDVYKFFTIFTGMKCHSLWLSSYNSSILYGFFWKALCFFLIIFKSGCWACQSFNTVTPSSAQLCCVIHNLRHEFLLCWKISLPSKFCIKLSSATECVWHNWSYHNF